MIIGWGQTSPAIILSKEEPNMFDFFKQAIEIYNDTFRFYKTVYELSSLSENDLQHLGIKRNDIPMVAMKASLIDK
jgi:uncharacterized protein YjiS (DUF1127 family)